MNNFDFLSNTLILYYLEYPIKVFVTLLKHNFCRLLKTSVILLITALICPTFTFLVVMIFQLGYHMCQPLLFALPLLLNNIFILQLHWTCPLYH